MKIRKPWVIKSLCFIGYWLVRALLATVTGKYWITTRDYSPGACGPRERYIYALWHEYLLVPMVSADLSRSLELIKQYRDLELGVADAAVAAAAESLGIYRLLTLDQRHFRAIKPRGSDHFVLLPADISSSEPPKTKPRKRR